MRRKEAPPPHRLIGVHASYSDRTRAARRPSRGGRTRFRLQVELHAACLHLPLFFRCFFCLFFFCMRSVYSKSTSSRSSCGSRDGVNHACESGRSTGWPGAARLPSNRGRPGCARRQHLHLPNVVQPFLPRSTEAFLFPANKKTSPPATNRATFLFCTLRLMCTKIRNVLFFPLCCDSPSCLQKPPSVC